MNWEWHPIDKVGIARFIDPDVINLLRLEQNVFDLRQQSPDDFTPVIELLYNRLQEQGIWYAAEKGITVTESQKIRRPDEILHGNREGTCLDLALLFCGLCLGHRLLPIFVLLEGHALVAVSVRYDSSQSDSLERPQLFKLKEGAVTEVDVLRKLIDTEEYILVECTGFDSSNMIPENLPEGQGRVDGLLTFEKAVEAGEKQLNYQNRPLKFALDVDMAHRLWGVKPDHASSQEKAHFVQEQSLAILDKINQSLISPIGGTPENLTDERHSRIEYGCNLLNQDKPKQALEYLTDLKTELWHKADAIIKYRLLANIGMARQELGQIAEAAAAFLEARQYNEKDEQALALAAVGYMFQKEYNLAEKLVQDVLQKNPANSIAHCLRVKMCPATDSLENIINKVPSPYRNNYSVMAALGQAALDRNLYTQAEEWFQTAINQSEGNANTIKVLLGITLMKLVVHDCPIIGAGQVNEVNRKKLEQARELFTEVLGHTHPITSDLTSTKFTAIVNRSSVLRLLQNPDEAIQDIEIALQVEPENPKLIKQRALLAYEKGDKVQAIKYLQRILANRETSEASLLAASLMIGEGQFTEAQNVLDDFLSKDNDEYFKTTAKQLWLELYIKTTDYENAKHLSKSLLDEEPNNILYLVSKIRLSLRTGEEENISELIDRAKSSVGKNNDLLGQMEFADLLFYELKDYRDAAEVYEHFVDKTLNNPLTHRLLTAYYNGGDYGAALDLCQQLLNRYGAIAEVSEMATIIYEIIDDLPKARQVCTEYLRLFYDDVSMQLRLALINYYTDCLDDLDRFLDSSPSIDNLSLEACQNLIWLYKVRERWHHCFEVLYETRRRFFKEGQVHAFYVISYSEGMQRQLQIPNIDESDINTLPVKMLFSGMTIATSPLLEKSCKDSLERVTNGCGVLLRDEFNSERWYILDDRPDVELARQELDRNQPLYQKLLDKNLGDEIVLAEDEFGILDKKTVTIVAIKDKYFAAAKQSLDLLDTLPNIKGFRSVPVPISEDYGIDPKFFQGLQEMLKQHEENFNRAKSDYRTGKIPLPLNTLAIVINKNPVKLWEMLVYGSEPYIHCWSNFQEKFDDSLARLKKGGLVIIDLVSLLTFYILGIADSVVQTLGKFGIAQSTLNLLRQEVEKCQGIKSDGESILCTINGQLVRQEFTLENAAKRKAYFEQLICWVRNNCYILPCRQALTISRDERAKRNEVLGFSSVDTLLIASEPNRILYSDDQWLRYFAYTESGVGGVWTQVVLKYCLQQKSINEEKYRNAILQLIYWGYNYTIVDADILLEGARQAEWNIKTQYLAVLKVLEDQRTSADYVIFVATDFLDKLYNEDIIPHYRDYLILKLLTAITAKRSKSRILKRLKLRLKDRFGLLYISRYQELLQLIQIWQDTQNIVT
ncbi:tetratricopeptide repeat protein [Coleofasciculus sp. E2-BRE-01]|uniref:tetratricopeptide repeat protein n=1 Tax=Coleofasciculus sp. E2-BRE-01 TaxID=3069524 RepID=UPI003302CA04